MKSQDARLAVIEKTLADVAKAFDNHEAHCSKRWTRIQWGAIVILATILYDVLKPHLQ